MDLDPAIWHPTRGIFGKRIRSVRRAIAARQIARDAIAGAVVSGAAVFVIAMIFPALPRLPMLGALGIGFFIGAVRARLRAPAEPDVVFFVDRRLGAEESIVTAYGLLKASTAVPENTRISAENTLRTADAKRLRIAIFGDARWGLLFACVLWCCAIALVPTRARPREERDAVRMTDRGTSALRRIETLAGRAPDPEQRARIDRAAEQARRLREDLAEGVERREALDQVQALREQIESARRTDTPDRRARQAAAAALSAEPSMQRALSAGDMATLDREVERAAARREAADRARARQGLSDAARAAADAGNEALAERLVAEEARLAARAEQAALARSLAESMPEFAGEEIQHALDKLASEGDGRPLDAAMAKATQEAWNRLSADERKRLTEAMQNARRVDPETSPGGTQQGRPPTADEIEQQLRQALTNLDQLQADVTLAPGSRGRSNAETSPTKNASGNGNDPNTAGNQGNSGQAGAQSTQPGSQGGGPSEGGGPGPRGGHTDPVAANQGPLARVRPVIGAGAPSQSTTEWIRPSGVAPNARGVPGTAPSAPSGGVRSIETDPVPLDYRDHVRRFFGTDPPPEGTSAP